MSLGRFSFLPFVREGLSNTLNEPAAGALRATTTVNLDLTGTGGQSDVSATVSKKIELYGPGDVVGIDTGQIIRTDPRGLVTDFEPNYLAAIEFYEEDYPWRYSPEAPDGARLKPWLALVVLAEGEHDLRSRADRPLPFVVVKDPDATLPDLTENWAWAHVQANHSLTGAQVSLLDEAATTGALADLLDRDPDLAYARLLCPRKLEPKTKYTAYLVPAFEAGRLAGLGLDISQAPGALHGAWRHPYPGGVTVPEPQSLPVYFHWQFETSERGDFEYLVRLLQAKVVDSRVGRRNIDVTRPGSNVDGITDPNLEGVLRLGGALQVPFDTLAQPERDIATKYEEWDTPYPVAFQTDLASFLNLGSAYLTATAGTANAASAIHVDPEDADDPMVVPPIYGQWHALTPRVLTDKDGDPLPQNDNWVHEANLDPRHRASAAFGTTVIQRHQETFMAGAWEQVGEVLAANRRTRFARMALHSSSVWHGVHLAGKRSQAPGTMVQTTYPLARRLLTGGTTMAATVRDSVVPSVMLSSAFRRATRPRASLYKRLSVDRDQPERDIVTRVAEGEVQPAPPKSAPPGVATPEDVLGDKVIRPAGRRRWLWIALILALVVALIALILLRWPIALLALLVAAYVGGRLLKEPGAPVGLGPGPDTEPPPPEAVDDLPTSPDFALADPYAPGPVAAPTFRPAWFATDSVELSRYKTALRDVFAEDRFTSTIVPVRPDNPIDIPAFAGQILELVDPKVIMPAKFGSLIRIPPRIVDLQVEFFKPVMSYPEFDTPMYQYLLDLSDEHFVPNLQYVQQNSISLLETNQPFIEAYMLGLNHEFCRELHWRSYPTDNRATPFRQFWDVSSFLDRDNKDDETLREELRDIPPIHLWSKFSQLGDHDHRDQGGPAENELVLVIRGDLLKRYPNAVIYAQRAAWQTHGDGSINNKVERRPVALSEAQEDNPPENLVKTPIYEAKVKPDLYFFGFDLTATEAQGESGDDPGDDPGWFFVIKERPGEPRFGLDVEAEAGATLATWSDLAWPNVAMDPSAPMLQARQNHSLTKPQASDERLVQWTDDEHVSWSLDANAGDLAYILYQLPVMVAVHAADMLPKDTS